LLLQLKKGIVRQGKRLPVTKQLSATKKLRELITSPGIITMPCCYDAFSAKLIEQAGFSVSFMSGFAVSAARLGMPDTGLISYAEMLDQGRNICDAVDIPVFGDGDTGYGNPVNVKRTVHGYIQAGFAGIMIEDQRSPKRCGHTVGKDVVERGEAVRRMAAAMEAREEARAEGSDIVIVARTDARATLGLDEAIERSRIFARLGADVLFVEAPESLAELKKIGRDVPGCTMANVLEQGVTPVFSPKELEGFGFDIVAYPLTLISAAALAMRDALAKLKSGESVEAILSFSEMKEVVGFSTYNKTLKKLESK
jgi:2-methylisocitrate lyase-like PEP mutase family enzyme